jgi:hypothetical protein
MEIASTTIKFFLLSSSINARFVNIVRAPIESDQTENRNLRERERQDPRKSNKIDQQLHMTSHAQRMTVSNIRGRRRRRRRRLGPSECVQYMKWV